MHLWHGRDDLRAGMRAAAFLAAIKRGALFIFQANTGECSPSTSVWGFLPSFHVGEQQLFSLAWHITIYDVHFVMKIVAYLKLS